MLLSTTLGFQPLRAHRDLNSGCSAISSSDCASCNSNPSCTLQKGVCTDFNSNRIRGLYFNQKVESAYCSNLSDEGYIYLEKQPGNEITLNRKNGAKVGSHDLCEWRIIVDSGSKVVINLSRNANIYEDVRIEAIKDDGNFVYTSKELLSCGSGTKQLELSDTSLIRVKVLIVDDKSDYVVTVKQELVKVEGAATWIVILVCCIAMGFTLLLWTFVIFCCYKKLREDCKQRKYSESTKSKILNNMRSGKYGNFQIEYEQNSCVI